ARPGRPSPPRPTFRRVGAVGPHTLASSAVRRSPDRFAQVRTFCFFVGHNKSGTSLLGGLLDGHGPIVLADGGGALPRPARGASGPPSPYRPRRRGGCAALCRGGLRS